VGVHQGTAPVVNAVCHALRLSRNEVVERVIALACIGSVPQRGNLLHRFIDQTMHPHDPHVHAMYTAFARSATGRDVRRVQATDQLRDCSWERLPQSQRSSVGSGAVGHLVLPCSDGCIALNVWFERSDAGMSMHCPYRRRSGACGPSRAAQTGRCLRPLARVPEQTSCASACWPHASELPHRN
jgi:hypothetical protein